MKNLQLLLHKESLKKMDPPSHLLGDFLYITTILMIIPFVKIYTDGIIDTNYLRNSLSVLLCISHYFICIKAPYSLLIFTNGNFKETKIGAYTEAFLNISISIILSFIIGMNGVIVGTLIAAIYRLLQYNAFVSKHILNRSPVNIMPYFIYTILCYFICYTISKAFLPNIMDGYLQWTVYALAVFSIAVIVSLALAFAMFFQPTKSIVKTFFNIFKTRIR